MSDVMNVSNLDKKNARVAISKSPEDTAWRFSDGLVSAIVQDTDSTRTLPSSSAGGS